MDEPDLQLLVAVSKRAVVFVLTFVKVLWELGAILGFIFLGVIDTLNSIV